MMKQRAALGILALVVASLATYARAEPRVFVAKLDGRQSVAKNSTPLSTRNGTGMGIVMYDEATGGFQFMLSFNGLIAQDITMGAKAASQDLISGNDFDGFGARLVHIHVGSPEANGVIPVNFVANDMMDGMKGVAPGVMVSPNPIQMATKGMVSGQLNINDLSAKNMGSLLAGVRVNGTGPSAADPQCLQCGFNQAIKTNNTYLNIHTFNNLFGEIRGQLIAQDCKIRSGVAIDRLLADLDTQVTAVGGRGARVDTLKTALQGVRQAVAQKNNPAARAQLSEFTGQVIQNPADSRISAADADSLICGATQLVPLLPIAAATAAN